MVKLTEEYPIIKSDLF